MATALIVLFRVLDPYVRGVASTLGLFLAIIVIAAPITYWLARPVLVDQSER